MPLPSPILHVCSLLPPSMMTQHFGCWSPLVLSSSVSCHGAVSSPSSLCPEGKPPPWGLTLSVQQEQGRNVLSGHRDTLELCGTRPKIVAQEITNMPQTQLPSLSRACGFVPSRPLAEPQDECALTIERMEHFESKMVQLPTVHFRVAKTTPTCA